MFSLPCVAGETGALIEELRGADPVEAKRIVREIELEWSKSGSNAMDLLLKRGRDALEISDFDAALEHLTALTDHAPDFAEGWHARATVYFQMQKYGQAMSDIEQTLALNPDHFGAIQGLAVILDTLGFEKRAYEAYRLVLDYHPHHEEVTEAVERLEKSVQGTSL